MACCVMFQMELRQSLLSYLSFFTVTTSLEEGE